MDQGSNKNHSPAYNFAPTVTKFCVMWEGQALPHDTKFGNCRCKIVDSRAFPSWSLIHGLRWSGLIKAEPGERRCVRYWYNGSIIKVKEWINHYIPHNTTDAIYIPLRWRHNDGDSVSNHQLHDCLLSRLFGRTSKKTSKLRVTGLCVGNSPWTGEFPAQMASNAENVSIWWRHHPSHELS